MKLVEFWIVDKFGNREHRTIFVKNINDKISEFEKEGYIILKIQEKD